jgi:two-component system response regulator HydG
MVLMVFSQDRNSLFVLSEAGVQAFREPSHLQRVSKALEHTTGPTFANDPVFDPPLIPGSFMNAPRQAILPIDYGDQILGALVVACSGACGCDLKELELAGMILNQSAGVINRAILHEESVYELQRKLEGSWDFLGIVGKDPKMQVVYKLIEDIARTDATVLIQGESGTGKELVARAIHQASDRADKPFVVINCSAYPDTLLESELFGHEKGAFTGAIRQKAGRFEQADGGTVFLDEVGEIPLPAQIKLLRVLQTQSFERLGGERTLKVEVRILAATNKELVKEVQKGSFREDLFYRLNVIPITLPPLRERRNDIPLLANHFLGRFASQQQKPIQEFSPEAMRVILDHSWPGNVRELENSVEHAVVLAKARRVEVTDLPSSVRKPEAQPLGEVSSLMEESERVLLEKVLSECSWNKKKAARRLGIGRSTLYAKLKRYGISKPTLQ